MSEFWIPITALICFAIIFFTNIVFNSKNKRELQQTIRHLVEKGENITPELLEKLGTFKSQRVIDLRRGLALISVGLSCIIAGIIIDEIRAGFAIGIFPLLLGAAFFICWKMDQYEN